MVTARELHGLVLSAGRQRSAAVLAVVQRHAGEMDPVTVASASRRSQDWGLRTLLVLDDSEVSDTIIVFMVYEGAFDRA